jgi:hypothetical protein
MLFFRPQPATTRGAESALLDVAGRAVEFLLDLGHPFHAGVARFGLAGRGVLTLHLSARLELLDRLVDGRAAAFVLGSSQAAAFAGSSSWTSTWPPTGRPFVAAVWAGSRRPRNRRPAPTPGSRRLVRGPYPGLSGDPFSPGWRKPTSRTARLVDRIVDGRVNVQQDVPSYLEVVLSYLDEHPHELPDLRC